MNKLTVKELIKTLQSYDKESFVAMSFDREGNSYGIIANEQYATQNVYLKDEFNKQDQFFEKTEVENGEDKTVQDFDKKENASSPMRDCSFSMEKGAKAN